MEYHSVRWADDDSLGPASSGKEEKLAGSVKTAFPSAGRHEKYCESCYTDNN